MLFILLGSDSALTRTPENTTLIPGTLLRLNCGTTLQASVLWSFTPEGSTSPLILTSHGDVKSEFKPYFYIDSASPYDLVAWTLNANESYCGTYTCAENRGAPGNKNATATVASKCI